jgi:hypothetical protein
MMSRAASLGALTFALLGASNAGASQEPTCRPLADRLAREITAGWKASTPAGEHSYRLLRDVLTGLEGGPGIGGALFELEGGDREAFAARSRALPSPFELSRDFAARLEEDVPGAASVFRFPGAELYAINSVNGTAHCNATSFFRVTRGVARPVESPPWLDADGEGCLAARFFVSIGGMPVVLDDRSSFGPEMTASITLTPWARSSWQSPCTVTFTFEPAFDAGSTLNDWGSIGGWPGRACDTAACEELRRGATELARVAQAEGARAEERLVRLMTPDQQAGYLRMRELATGSVPNASGGEPLALPLVAGGATYLAHLRHFTIGWRTFSDWEVTVERLDGAKLASVARFAIGMSKGRMKGFEIAHGASVGSQLVR